MKKILRTLALSLLLGIGFSAMPYAVLASSECGTFLEENLPDSFDRFSVISALLGPNPEDTKAEDIKVGFFRLPGASEAHVIWAWKSGAESFYSGIVRNLDQKNISQDQWVIEPLREMHIGYVWDVKAIKSDCTYKLGALQYVFGLRVPTFGPRYKGGWNLERLWLFAEHKGKLFNIFQTGLRYEDSSNLEYRSNASATSCTATIRPIGAKAIPDLEQIAVLTNIDYNSKGKKTSTKKNYRQFFVWSDSENTYRPKENVKVSYPYRQPLVWDKSENDYRVTGTGESVSDPCGEGMY